MGRSYDNASPPGSTSVWSTERDSNANAQHAAKWDGEWNITYVVFRDLGFAFAIVLILIYVLVVGWFQSFMTPFVIMAVIPFSLVDILPAHWLMGAFFNAPCMIGFIAGAGIVVRNSVIVVDFIELVSGHVDAPQSRLETLVPTFNVAAFHVEKME